MGAGLRDAGQHYGVHQHAAPPNEERQNELHRIANRRRNHQNDRRDVRWGVRQQTGVRKTLMRGVDGLAA